MKSRTHSPLLMVGGGLLLTVLAAWSVAATRDNAPSPAIQHKIDALLKSRLRPEPLPINPPNPFQMTSGLKREILPDELAARVAAAEGGLAAGLPGREDRPKENTGPSDADVLVSCATRLKLGGIIVLKDQIQIVVNGIPRKEGDVIAAEWNNTFVKLLIVRLLPGQMLLRYNTAEATVPF